MPSDGSPQESATSRSDIAELTISRCWAFYWPLALTAAMITASGQVLNASLRFYEDPTRELATVAIAFSIFGITCAFLAFLSQTVNVLADSRQAQRLCLRFSLGLGLALAGCLALLAFSPLGGLLLEAAYDVDAAMIHRAQRYLRHLAPLPALMALRHFLMGLLVQRERTGAVTVGNLAGAVALVAVLVGGVLGRVTPVVVLPAAMIAAELANLAVLVGHRPCCREREDAAPLTLGRILHFFLPTSVTTIMYAASRPVIYAFASRLPDKEATIAGLRLGFDLVMLFHFPLNQFRHVMVTFGREHLATVRRFMAVCVGAVTVLMLVVALTPLSGWVFGAVLGGRPEVVPVASAVFLVLVSMPLVITVRNFYHGQSLISRATLTLGVGAIGRIGIITLLSWLGARGGWFGPRAAAATLLAGFLLETLVAWWAVRARARRTRVT